jgi:ABC-type transport system substrate-binding protein
VILNSASPPFNDPDARLALAYATDQVDYIKTITGGLNQPADSAYAPGSRWYNPIAYPTYDPAKAAELVAKVKTRNGGEFTFELMAQDTPNAQSVQQYLQTQWAKVGITARAVNVKQEAKIIATVIGSYQATVMQLFDSPSPDNDCFFWKPSGRPTGTASVNFSRVDDPELRQACLDLAGTSDFAARKVLVGKIQERIAKSVPYVWLAHTSRTVAANKRVTNLTHWTLPDGSAGLDFIQGSLSLYQVWMKS